MRAEEGAEAALLAAARELLQQEERGEGGGTVEGGGALPAAVAFAADPVPHSLGSYERLMLARAGAKVLQSRAVAAFLHSPSAAVPVNCAAAAAARDTANMSLMGCRRRKAGVGEGEGLDAVYAPLSAEEDRSARFLAVLLQQGLEC